MSYGLSEVYETSMNNTLNSNVDYHHTFPSHYSPHSRTFSNGFHPSLRFNGHSLLDESEEELLQQPSQMQHPHPQRIEDDYEINDMDKPKLLMWGLSKYYMT